MNPAAPAANIAPVILCVEDRALSLAARQAILEEAGYRVLSATSGTEALDLLTRFHVDLVLSDHYLRDERGIVIASKIRSLKPEIPILLISGSVQRLIDLEEAKHIGGLIAQDAGPTHLLVCIATALRL